MSHPANYHIATSLCRGNLALRQQNYVEAIQEYVDAIIKNSLLGKSIAINILLAQNKNRASCKEKNKIKVAFFSWKKAENHDHSARTLLEWYKNFAHVEYIFSEELPFLKSNNNNESIPGKIGKTNKQLNDLNVFIDGVLKFAIQKKFEIVHFQEFRILDIVFAIVYRLVWGASVITVIGDEDTCPPGKNVFLDALSANILAKISVNNSKNGKSNENRVINGLPEEFLSLKSLATSNTSTAGQKFCFEGSPISDALEFQKLLLSSEVRWSPKLTDLLTKFGNETLNALQFAADISWLKKPRLDSSATNRKIWESQIYKPEPLAKNSLEVGQRNFSWTSQRDLNGLADERQILLGGMCLGRLQPPPEQQQLPKPVVDSIEAFSRIVDMPKFHRLRVMETVSLESMRCISGDPSLCSIHCFDKANLDFSVWYVNDRDLRMQIVTGGDGEFKSFVFRGYQYDPKVDGGLVLVCEHAIDSNLAFLDLALINPYLPILLTLSNPDATLVDATLIPYPSLLPGGLHETEFLAAEGQTIGALASALMSEHLQASDASVGWGLAKLLVDTTEAIGSERIFSRDFKEWLWSVFSLRLNPCIMSEVDSPLSDYWREVFQLDALPSAEKLAIHGKRHRQGSTLVCPPDAIPSLRLLTASLADGGLGRVCALRTHLFDRPGFPKHRYRVTMPAGFATSSKDSFALDGAIRRPFIMDSQKSGLSERSPAISRGAIAISMPRLSEYSKVEDLRLLMPVAPEIDFALGRDNPPASQPKIFVVMTGEEFTRETFALCLESLQLQRQVELCSIILAPSRNADCAMLSELLKCYFPQRYEILPVSSGTYAQSVQQAAAKCLAKDEAACILFINKPLLLHDARTLPTLAALLARSKVATSSCMLIARCQQPKAPAAYDIASSGNFSAGSAANGEMRFAGCDARSLLSDSVYPVAWNHPALLMVQAHRWAKNRGFANGSCHDQSGFIEYSAKQSLLGDIHLCTTRISAELLIDLPPSDRDTTNISQEAIAALAAGGMQIEGLPS